MNSKEKQNVAVLVGATGLVGSGIISVLDRIPLKIDEFIPLASERSRGIKLEFRGRQVTVDAFDPGYFSGAKWVFFSGKDGLSEEFCPVAESEGAWVIDNSSVFRLRDGIPLVVPEVNIAAAGTSPRIIANPNCSTIQLAVALKPLDDAFGLKRVIVSTYQSASGAGGDYLDKLVEDTGKVINDGFESVGKKSLAFNCLPDVGSADADGRFSEETKLEKELDKILGKDVPVCATAVRVPVQYCHGESVVIETDRPIDPGEARKVMSGFDGIEILDDMETRNFPDSRIATGTDPVWVGRIRNTNVFENGLAFWVVADNLLKGAALNAVQIAYALEQRT